MGVLELCTVGGAVGCMCTRKQNCAPSSRLMGLRSMQCNGMRGRPGNARARARSACLVLCFSAFSATYLFAGVRWKGPNRSPSCQGLPLLLTNIGDPSQHHGIKQPQWAMRAVGYMQLQLIHGGIHDHLRPLYCIGVPHRPIPRSNWYVACD